MNVYYHLAPEKAVLVIEMYEKEDMKSLFKKVNDLRADVLTKDWSDDKNFMMNGKIMYPYLSADKVKKTIAPLLHKHGLELVMEFSELTQREEVGGFKQHWSIRLDATLVDTDTGCSTTSTVYGEAGDVGDKGVNKAQTTAIKQWVLSQFLIADGIDPEGDSPMIKTTYTPKTPEENEEVRSKILSQTVPPAPVAPPVVKPKVEAVKPPVAPPVPPAAPKGDEVSLPQRKAMDRIVNNLSEQVKAGKFDVEEYTNIRVTCDTITTDAEAIEFIKKYKGLTA